MTFPTTTDEIRDGSIFPEARAALAAISWRSTQVWFKSFPPKVPNAVRLAETMKIPETIKQV